MRYETRIVPVGDGDARTYDFECACGFTSTGWPQKKLALARGIEHATEHKTGEPARELVEFRAEHNLNGPAVDLVRFDDVKG